MKKNISIIYAITLIILPCLLANCGQKNKAAQTSTLKNISNAAADYATTQDGVTVRVKTYTTTPQTSRILNPPLDTLPQGKNGIYPIQLNIFNNSAQPWKLAHDAVDLDTLNQEYIAQQLHKNIPLRLFFKSSVIVGGFCAASLTVPPFSPVLFTASALALFTIPGPGDANRCNKKVQQQLDAVLLPNEITIYPHQTANYLVFVEQQDFRPTFDLTLRGNNNTTLNFKIDVNQENNS